VNGRRRAAHTGEEVSMQYLLLIYGEEGALESVSQAERHAVYEEYDRFAQDLQERQAMVGGDELSPTSSATTVRVRDGQTLTTDGPFAETKEQLGGYFKIEAADLDTAIELAAKIPGARTGSIEVRPVVEG
jgi:hypothetical protein